MSNSIVDNDTHYEFFDTSDGSPSIRLSSSKFRTEAMHHCDGALSESLFIYHKVLHEALAQQCPPRVLSVGLGCGYNELIATAHFLSSSSFKPYMNSLESNTIYIESFEGDANLRETFLEWLSAPHIEKNSTEAGQIVAADTQPSEIRTSLKRTFNRTLELVCENFKITPVALKNFLLKLKEKNQFVLRGWLTENTTFAQTFGVIFFDAFSNQSTPELWTEKFLVQFLSCTSADKCGFATYAATGALNRALKLSCFIRCPQAGFSGKRESTLAFKGCGFDY